MEIEKRKNEKIISIIEKMKNEIKKEPSFLEKCKEYKKDPNFIDEVKITFEPLDVSAKTIDGRVILNENLLKTDWVDIIRYGIHELIHCLQQAEGLVNGKVEKKDYLDDENEQEAFQAQISYMSDHEDPEEIQQYLEQLLDHHNIQGKEREEKKKKLLEDV